MESYEASICADVRIQAVSISLQATGIYAGPGSGPGVKVVDENVISAIRVISDQVGGIRVKNHVAAIAAYTGFTAGTVGLVAAGVHADPDGGTSITIVDENILFIVGIAGDQVGSI
jgi:hypothetical protein